MGRKIIILHIAGYTVDDFKAIERQQVEIPKLQKKYAKYGIEFREAHVWPMGLTKISVFDAAKEAVEIFKKARAENPNTLIGFSGHSLGGIAAIIATQDKSIDVDFLILQDVPFGGTPDWVLDLKFDLENPAVITGLCRSNNIPAWEYSFFGSIDNTPRDKGKGPDFIRKALQEKDNWPPVIEIKGWFAVIGERLFKSFPDTGLGKVAIFPRLNHHQIWKHQKVVNEVVRFIQSVNYDR